MKYLFGSPLLFFVAVGSPTTTTAYIEDSMMRKPSSPSYGTTEWSPNVAVGSSTTTTAYIEDSMMTKPSSPSYGTTTEWNPKSFLPKVSIRPLGETPPVEDTINLDGIIRTEYHKWSIRHGKVKEAERFEVFKQNFALQMESNRNTGEFFLLNQFGDLTVDEYESMMESSQILTTAETEEYSGIISPVVPNAMDIDSLNLNDLVQLQQEDFSPDSPMLSATTNMNMAVVSDKPSIIDVEENPSVVEEEGSRWDQFAASYTPSISEENPSIVEEEGPRWDQFVVSDTPSIIEENPSIVEEEGSRWDTFAFAMDFADGDDDDDDDYNSEENYKNIAHVVDLNEVVEYETESWAEENHGDFEVVHDFPIMNSRSTISLTNPPSMVPISNTVISSSQWEDTVEEESIANDSNSIKSTSTTTSATASVSRKSFFTKLNGPSKAALAFMVAPLVSAVAASTTRIPFSVKRYQK